MIIVLILALIARMAPPAFTLPECETGRRSIDSCSTRNKASELKRAAGNGVKLVISQGLNVADV
jgi:hypothetical protein